MAPKLDSLDHLVLTVADLAATVAFYRDVLGMVAQRFDAADGSRRWALYFGVQKINLHQAGSEFTPYARAKAPGSADLCFLSAVDLSDWQVHLGDLGVEIEAGPLPRSGATGPITSLYLRDPDGALIEIANQV